MQKIFYLIKKLQPVLIAFIKLIYFILIVVLPIFLLYVWNFQYVDKIIEFLKVSWWPLVLLFVVLLFREEFGRFINEISELDIFGNKAKRDKQQVLNQTNSSKTEVDFSLDYKDLNEQYKSLVDALNNNVSDLKKQLTNKEIELDFERIYNVIFGSQIFILKYLINSNVVGLDDLSKYYSTVQKNNIVLQNWGIDQYLSFLISSKLIESAPTGGFQITLKGRVFITYIEEIRKYNLSKTL